LPEIISKLFHVGLLQLFNILQHAPRRRDNFEMILELLQRLKYSYFSYRDVGTYM